jgi:hypothetical protein
MLSWDRKMHACLLTTHIAEAWPKLPEAIRRAMLAPAKGGE